MEGRLRAVTALLATAIVVAVTVLAGCTEARPDVVRTLGPVGAAYWNRARLLGALPLDGGDRATPTPGASAKSHAVPTGAGLRVGALFEHSDSGNHYCTASVVDSPGQDLLITAAHCIYNDGGYDSDIVFIPDYRNGQEPYGVWTVARLLVPSPWQESANPDYDFGFVVLNSHSGMNIEQILGANQLGSTPGTSTWCTSPGTRTTPTPRSAVSTTRLSRAAPSCASSAAAIPAARAAARG